MAICRGRLLWRAISLTRRKLGAERGSMPNFAFNRTRRHVASFSRAVVAARRLTWSLGGYARHCTRRNSNRGCIGWLRCRLLVSVGGADFLDSFPNRRGASLHLDVKSILSTR